ncbi:uncharacterized protein BKA78DRAFT_273545 [Phyllosticta capitalensis]|uniref:Nuclear polyadenylated RNA-binding protein NAB2 n=1 Tax=Phyllosticta capitalensis TaxID=121624 RepID=A0ABR1YF43_9PEZI
MSVELQVGTPLANALQSVVQPKLAEVGWSSGASDDTALSEYIILMLVNGKTQEQIASELANDLLSLGPDDPDAANFSRWLFEQLHSLNSKMNGSSGPPEAQPASNGDQSLSVGATSQDAEMGEASQTSIPTGPKAMRNGNQTGREKRMMGHLNKAMERNNDAALHRVRGGGGGMGRINSHAGREAPKGPRHQANRNMAIMNGMNGMGGMPGMNGMGMSVAGNMMPPQSQMAQMDIFRTFEAMSAQMAQMSQALAATGHPMPPQQPYVNPAFQKNFRGGPNQGKSLFDRVDPSSRPNRNKPQHMGKRPGQGDTEMGEGGVADAGASTEAMDVESKDKEPWDIMCKFNNNCNNAKCPYAHQAPLAPAGITVDLGDQCSFGVRCTNFKCTAKHPSPAQKMEFQQKNPCKFGMHCTNPGCPFQHPPKPCRFNESCTNPDCKFTHVETKCKFTPCLNPHCFFKHDPGQRAANGAGKEHVSERKFIDENQAEELILPAQSQESDEAPKSEAQEPEVAA